MTSVARDYAPGLRGLAPSSYHTPAATALSRGPGGAEAQVEQGDGRAACIANISMKVWRLVGFLLHGTFSSVSVALG